MNGTFRLHLSGILSNEIEMLWRLFFKVAIFFEDCVSYLINLSNHMIGILIRV